MSYPHIESGKKAAVTSMSYGLMALGFMLLRQSGGEQFESIMRTGLVGSSLVFIPAFIYQIGKSIRQTIAFERKMKIFNNY